MARKSEAYWPHRPDFGSEGPGAAAGEEAEGCLESLHQLALGERSVVLAEPSMVQLFALLERLAHADLPVLVHGETGVGKENAAWSVHYWSRRRAQPFLALNCAALPESLVESELFGYERGAFSGALQSRKGLLESAHGGTVFLDEVAELSLTAQAKLLRALDQGCITPVGAVQPRHVDVRFVAATHRDLAEEVKAGRFRLDLYHRISAARVTLPPLRERPREIPLLAHTFLAAACRRLGDFSRRLLPAALCALQAYAWPGNVRELKNVMEFVAATCPEPLVDAAHLPAQLAGRSAWCEQTPQVPAQAEDAPRAFRPIAQELRELERRRMLEALEVSGGVQAHAAALIGMPRRTFVTKYKQYRLGEEDAPRE